MKTKRNFTSKYFIDDKEVDMSTWNKEQLKDHQEYVVESLVDLMTKHNMKNYKIFQEDGTECHGPEDGGHDTYVLIESGKIYPTDVIDDFYKLDQTITCCSHLIDKYSLMYPRGILVYGVRTDVNE